MPQHSAHPEPAQAIAYDLRPYVQAAQSELQKALLQYRNTLPDTLISMGKFALSGPMKLFSLPESLEEAITANVAPWPVYVLLSCRAALRPEARDAWQVAVPEAVAVEIAMAGADLLDELADQDPSAFVAKYGAGQALNTGNLMLVLAQDVVRRHAQQDGDEQALEALGALHDMLVRAAVGQHLDMRYEQMAADEVTLEMSAEITDMKAGALVAGACRMGAIMSGADHDVAQCLARFGQAAGSIAQLINDVQDVMPGDEAPDTNQAQNAAVPKTDLRLRKRTLPIVFALRDDSPSPNAVQSGFASKSAGPVDEEALRRAVLDAGGIQFANVIADVHRQNALEALAALEVLRPGAAQVLGPIIPR